MIGQKVFKAHNIHTILGVHELKKNVMICHCIRDPMDIIASLKKTGKDIHSFKLKNLINCIPNTTSHHFKIITFKYEKFKNNQFDYIYKVIEKGFNVTIDENTKKEIENHFSISSLKKISSNFSDFSTYDKATGIHGNHINNSSWEKSLTLEESLYFYKTYYLLRKEFGYNDLNIEKMWWRVNWPNR